MASEHAERAFAHYMRARRVPCVAIDEARRSLLPASGARGDLKSFDFLVHGEGMNLIVDVKGRRLGAGRAARPRAESWVTRDDVESLRRWGELFGEKFAPVFVFLYWSEDQPGDGLFEEVFAFEGLWYAVRAVDLRLYERWMTARSERWRTVHIPSAVFDRISQPFLPSPSESGSGAGPIAALQPIGASISSIAT